MRVLARERVRKRKRLRAAHEALSVRIAIQCYAVRGAVRNARSKQKAARNTPLFSLASFSAKKR
jgi:hypothetical protein